MESEATAIAPARAHESPIPLDVLRRFGDARREARRKVGHHTGGDMLVYVSALCGSVLEERRSLHRRDVMRTLAITLDQYKGAISALRASGLIEWSHEGGRSKAQVRLSHEGIAWARSAGLLTDPPEGHESGSTGAAA